MKYVSVIIKLKYLLQNSIAQLYTQSPFCYRFSFVIILCRQKEIKLYFAILAQYFKWNFNGLAAYGTAHARSKYYIKIGAKCLYLQGSIDCSWFDANLISILVFI